MIRVMVVDDEPPIQRIICRKIEDADAEFQVTATAYNGEEALELLEKGETDVLFADVSMPVMDGLELLEEVNRRDIPVIPVILSGYKEFDYVRRAFSNHVTDYLLKPLNDNELKMLLCRIKKIIQQKRFEEHAQDFELALSGQERLSDGKSGEQCLLVGHKNIMGDVKRVRSMLSEGILLFHVDPCVNTMTLVEDMENYVFDEEKNKIKEGQRDDTIDSLEYATKLYYDMPMQMEAV